ncbi:hypothetical protein CLV89_101283 [Tritonibacter scottomollicae]|uniref:Uncharacterized protein n=1 Tax=Tritonibacter scottomollicae TaxID=483013 RepID=A0A2T1ANH9_TRISK|nr:hypothetical protein CLV89_101283 [Tritonibacter scottomollicae]
MFLLPCPFAQRATSGPAGWAGNARPVGGGADWQSASGMGVARPIGRTGGSS